MRIKISNAFRQGVINALTLCFVAGLAVISWFTFGPAVEVFIKPPLYDLSFDEFTCEGPDAIAEGILDKAFYPADGGDSAREATFVGMTLLPTDGGRDRIPWQRRDPNDHSPISRPGGLQRVDIRVFGGCGADFYVYTYHISPVTALRLKMSWGPFGPSYATDVEGAP